MSGLATVTGDDNNTSTLTIDGEMLDITALTIGQMGPLLTALKPAMSALQALMDSGEFDLQNLTEGQMEALVNAAAIATRKEASWVEQLAIDDFITLATEVVVVNMDFFSKRLGPAIERLEKRMNAVDGDGKTPSSN